jgi:hypothetical protein
MFVFILFSSLFLENWLRFLVSRAVQKSIARFIHSDRSAAPCVSSEARVSA